MTNFHGSYKVLKGTETTPSGGSRISEKGGPECKYRDAAPGLKTSLSGGGGGGGGLRNICNDFLLLRHLHFYTSSF